MIKNKLPKAVFLQIINRCNSKCLMCPYKDTYAKQPKKQMALGLFKKILNDLTPEYRGQIGLYLHCEPFLDSRLFELITMAKKLCPESNVQISTNASSLGSVIARELCKTPVDTIIFNVNGGTKETYEKLMPPLVWDETIHNIKYFLKIFKKRVYINFVKTEANQSESNLLKNIFPDVKIVDEYWAVNRGGSIDIKKPAKAKTKFNEEEKKCFQLTTNMNILTDGDVILCCNCWDREVVLGSAYNENILEIWGNNYLSHYEHEVCKKCS